MFSKKLVIIVTLVVLIAVNIIALSITSRRISSYGCERISISFVAPLQFIFTCSIRFAEGLWKQYFYLVSVEKENRNLKKLLNLAIEKNNRCKEIKLSNLRIRRLLNFQVTMDSNFLAAEVIGKDPSVWFKNVIIDKGKADGVLKGFPVVVPEGIAGQVIDVSNHYSKVLLIIDQNSAVDALVQRTRAGGIIKGEPTGRCRFKYALRKHDISVGDTIVSSGLDGVFPKGLIIGHVTEVIKRNAGIFQEVTVDPNIDYEKLEEVLIILDPPKDEFHSK